jgi:hypothetical protein
MIYTIMNGHRGGYELDASALRLNPTTKMENEKAHRRKRVRKMQIGIMLVHSATVTVWRRRTRGMLAGTKLAAWK